jgi:beta-glucosidase
MDPNNKYTSKYLDESNEPLYPFGFGLSYTTFAYGEVKLSATSISDKDDITVACKVKNTGRVEGEEVVQLYLRDVVGSVTRPVKELKDFKKITLAPGEEQEVTFTLQQSDLSFYKKDMSFGTEPGKFIVSIGTNSRDLHDAEFLLN